MTVSTNDNKIIYAGNGTTVTFPVPFLFYDDAHVVVRTKKDETVTDCVRGVDYSIAGAGDDNGGTVTFFAAPDDGTQVSILREVPFVQNTQYLDGDPMPAELLERNLDVLTMQTQQLKEQSDRAVTVDIFSNSDPSQIVGKIEGLYDDRDKLITVAEHIAAVDVCSDNIEAIRDAPNQAAAASASASAATLAEAGAADSRDKASASESSAVVSRDKAAASENKARDYALQTVRRNVGDVFYTTRSDDALNGAVPADGSIYNVSDFSGEADVPALLAAGKLPYVSMAEYAERLTEVTPNYTYYQGILKDGAFTANPFGRIVPDFNPDYQQYGSWEFRTRFYYINRGGTGNRHILGVDGSANFGGPCFAVTSVGALYCWITSNGTSWNIANSASMGKTLTSGVWYDLAFGFDGASYYFRWKEATQSDEKWTTSWTLANVTKALSGAPILLMNHRVTASLDLQFWNGGFMSISNTWFTADGVQIWKGNTPVVGQKSCSVFGWDGAGSTKFRVPLAEKPKRVLVAKKEPASEAEQTWWNLYSDGWLEQGDMICSQAVATQTIQNFVELPRSFRDTNYTVMTVSEGGIGDALYSGVTIYPKNASSFCFAHRYYGRYIACGYAEVPTESEYQFQNIEAQRAMVQVATGNTDNALVTATTVLPRMNRLEERFQIVSALPENPDAETFYFVINQGG